MHVASQLDNKDQQLPSIKNTQTDRQTLQRERWRTDNLQELGLLTSRIVYTEINIFTRFQASQKTETNRIRQSSTIHTRAQLL